MASPNVYNIGATTGGRWLTRSPVYMSGVVWYVGPGGADAVSPQGRERAYPLATLAQAYTNASAGDAIVFLANHAETLGSAQTLGKDGLYIASEGSDSTRAQFTCSAGVAMFDVTASYITVENIYFKASTAAPTARVRITNAGNQVVGCRFDCGASDTAPGLLLSNSAAAHCRVVNTKFVSTATAAASRPTIGFEASAAVNNLEFDTVTFDGGTYGWSDYALKGTAAITNFRALDVDFLNGADMILATASSYRFHRRLQSGSVNTVFTA